MARFLRDVRDGNLTAVQRCLATNSSAVRSIEPGTERTPLHIAAANQQPAVIAALLAANAPHDAKDSGGNVPLHLAVQTGDLLTVMELLGRGAKVGVKAKNNLGATPLHLAAKLGATRVARELLAVGARPDAKDQRGKVPADVVPRGNEELAELLREAVGAPSAAASPSRPSTAPSTPKNPNVTPARSRLTAGLGHATASTSAAVANEVMAGQLEKQAALAKGTARTLQQLNAKVDNLELVVEEQRTLLIEHAGDKQTIGVLNNKVEGLEVAVEATRAPLGENASLARNTARSLQQLSDKVEYLEVAVAEQRAPLAHQTAALSALESAVQSHLGALEGAVLAHNGPLKQHAASIAEQDKALQSLSTMMSGFNGAIKAHDEPLEQHAAAIADHGRALQQLTAQVDQMQRGMDAQRAQIEKQAAALMELCSAHADELRQFEARTAGQLREVQELQLHAAEANAEALRAAGVSARTAQADQAEATQSMQTSLLKRHEKLALDLRTQLGGMDGRLTSAEGHAASYLGAVDALQMQVEALEARLAEAERLDRPSVATGPLQSSEVMRKVEALERRIAASERQRATDRQRDLPSASSDDYGLEDEPSPRSVVAADRTEKAVRKQAELIGGLQTGLATLEARLADYQEAMTAASATGSDADSADYLAGLRAVLDPASSEASSATSAEFAATRTSSEASGAAMTAVLTALEGLSRELSRLRARTAQQGDQSHTADMRLGYVEGQVVRMKATLKQVNGWLTLSNPQEDRERRGLARSSSGSRSSKQAVPGTPTRRPEHSPGGILRSSSSAGLLPRSPSRGPESTAVVLPIQFGSSDFT